MKHEQKLNFLHAIDREDRFRKHILIPLFRALEVAPIETHGSLERGKDIVCKEINAIGLTEYISIVAKIGNITGSVSGPNSYSIVRNQVNDSFDFAYKDTKINQEVSINKVFVITNKKILQTAKDKIVTKLREPRAAHANVHYLEDEDLVELISQNSPQIWKTRLTKLGEHGLLNKNAALVLYVIATVYNKYESSNKTRYKNGITIDNSMNLSGLPKKQLTEAIDYLTLEDQAWVQAIDGESYKLHDSAANTTLRNLEEIEMLLTISKLRDNRNLVTKSEIKRKLRSAPYSLRNGAISTLIKKFIKGNYLEKDKMSIKDRFRVIISTIDDERPYFDVWLTYKGSFPIHIKKRRSKSAR